MLTLNAVIKMRHIIEVLCINHAGVLSRVSGLFSRRGYNIDSLNVNSEDGAEHARITVSVRGDERIVGQIQRQLEKLVDVIEVTEVTEPVAKRGNKIDIFDSTLRDGAQAEGVSFSGSDKLKIVQALDKLGVAYIEAGNPYSNPKDAAFLNHFIENPAERPRNARLVAFGSTRRKESTAEDDANLAALLSAGTPAVAVVGKCSLFQVQAVLNTKPEENLNMIRESVAYLTAAGREVIFDAEHFFDGFREDRRYALECLAAAEAGGADCLVLCDTNGGALPYQIADCVAKVRAKVKTQLGIHCHNDSGLAVANSIVAAEAGATQIQGTLTGFGERCGNANLSSVIPTLQLKMGMGCIPTENMTELTYTARLIADTANDRLDTRSPYVGASAFTHKGGMHVDGVNKHPESFEHIQPGLVGNVRRTVLSEIAGRSAILNAIRKVAPHVTKDSPETEAVIKRLKEMEHEGYQFESAESSFELCIRKCLGMYEPFFTLGHYKIIGEQSHHPEHSAAAMINIKVGGQTEVTAAEGDGPVNALDKALRKALEVFYPQLRSVKLTDYKVRVLDSGETTASKVRVLIGSADGERQWTPVGVSHDIIEASWLALVDSIEYKLIQETGGTRNDDDAKNSRG
jgi:2-isopropylmalate synthase